jgi:hypothetical protein
MSSGNCCGWIFTRILQIGRYQRDGGGGEGPAPRFVAVHHPRGACKKRPHCTRCVAASLRVEGCGAANIRYTSWALSSVQCSKKRKVKIVVDTSMRMC